MELELAAEDAACLRDSKRGALHKRSPAKFVKDSLDLEDAQYVCI